MNNNETKWQENEKSLYFWSLKSKIESYGMLNLRFVGDALEDKLDFFSIKERRELHAERDWFSNKNQNKL